MDARLHYWMLVGGWGFTLRLPGRHDGDFRAMRRPDGWELEELTPGKDGYLYGGDGVWVSRGSGMATRRDAFDMARRLYGEVES